MTALLTASELIDRLTYINYAHNRTISPSVSVERWRKAYGPTTDAMEEQYQKQLAFDGMLNRITKMVERAEPDDVCDRCFGLGEYISGASDSDYGEVIVCGCKEPA